MTNLGRNASGFFTTLEQSTITVKVVKGFDKDGNPEEWIATVYPLAYLVEAVFFVGLCMLGLAIIMASYCSGFAFNLTEVWLILVCGANWIVLVINLRLLLSE